MYAVNAGTIELVDGYSFLWNRGTGDGEIFGSIRKPNGSLLNGSSGWYRTTSPEVAAMAAVDISLPV